MKSFQRDTWTSTAKKKKRQRNMIKDLCFLLGETQQYNF